MDLIHAQQGEYLVVTVNAMRIDASAALEFKDSMNTIDESNSKILLNLEQIEFIDSSGLDAIISVMKHMGKERKMDLCAITPTVEKVFRLMRMDSIFSIYAKLEQAVSDQKRQDSELSNNLIRFQLRTSENFDAVRIGLGRFIHVLETLNTQIDLGKVELVLAEVLNNIAEHGGRESLNHPISLKWHTSDRLCINVINAGRCIPTGTITNAQMPNLDTEIDNLPEGGFGWALVDILCSKVRSKRRGSLNTLRLNFPKK